MILTSLTRPIPLSKGIVEAADRQARAASRPAVMITKDLHRISCGSFMITGSAAAARGRSGRSGRDAEGRSAQVNGVTVHGHAGSVRDYLFCWTFLRAVIPHVPDVLSQVADRDCPSA